MGIYRVYVSLRSNESTLESISTSLDLEPTTASDHDPGPRPKAPTGGLRYVWEYEAPLQSDVLEERVRDLEPVLARLASVDLPAEVERSLVVFGSARPLGFVFSFAAQQLALVAAAGCQLVLDVYDSDDETRSPP